MSAPLQFIKPGFLMLITRHFVTIAPHSAVSLAVYLSIMRGSAATITDTLIVFV